MNEKLSISDLPLAGKRVLMRVDFNVPLDKDLNITDDTRISAAVHTIKYVLENNGSLVLMSHLGRPKGKVDPHLSLAPCAKRLSELLGMEVKMAPDCVGPDVEEMAKKLKPGEILLLENLRFHSAEEHPDQDLNFARQLANLGDVYVNDAFGTAHRAHSSTVTVAQYFPGKAAAGFLLDKEIEFLGEAISDPDRPFYAIIGGAKISSKLGVLKALLNKVDALFIGGGMTFTFFKAQGVEISDSIHEEDLIEEAKEILELARQKKVKLFLPVDTVVVERIEENSPTEVVDFPDPFPPETCGVDIGPRTIELFSEELSKAGLIFWNGPLGVFEVAAFAKGTQAIAKVVADLDATTIVGGGDSVAALQSLGYADRISHISTGGGAALEYIENGTLPGIEALSEY